ncbi:profilin [Russula ochroleuca]|jgi:profilin|uniref:Profilin n=1 Tax=Russula ochroleuca TaxID=152965 RepID=A0A9P5N0U2_9AGAM|nr:profilin [Russula ochroleuca]
MSWQAYVDTNLVGSGKLSRAAILGLGGGIWATSPGYTLSNEEQKAILASYKDLTHTQANGLRLAGEKFFTLRADNRSIYLKKGGDGAVLVKTSKAILIAEYTAPIQAAEATQVVESLADYLISVKY